MRLFVLRRHVCFPLLTLFSLLSCQAFVTSSGFHGQAIRVPFLRHRGGAATPLSADGSTTNHKDNNSQRLVGPLGVLRSPPSSGRRSGGANEEKDKEELRRGVGGAGGRSSNKTDKKQVVQVSTKGLYRNSNKPQQLPDDDNEKSSTTSSDGNAAFMSSQQVEYVAETKLPTDIGAFQLRGYKIPGAPLGQEPCVIYCRDKPPFGKDGAPAVGVPVRIHDQCLTSEVFRSQR